MHHFIKGLLHQRKQNHQRGQNGYTLNPVKFSLNCFLAALFYFLTPSIAALLAAEEGGDFCVK